MSRSKQSHSVTRRKISQLKFKHLPKKKQKIKTHLTYKSINIYLQLNQLQVKKICLNICSLLVHPGRKMEFCTVVGVEQVPCTEEIQRI